MKIERLEIAGFKSFADPAVIVFHQGSTAVVGPNGCGKSNIADAVSWVLGELGTTAIRARGRDLIFGGSELRPPLGVAEVRLEASGLPENGNGAASNGAWNGAGRMTAGSPAETNGSCHTERVVVTRRVDRSGSSIYELDGRRSTRREIRRRFAGTGMGAGSYAMIGQGRVTEVLTSKPEELRRLVEEAAGLGAYRLNRRETESNLDATRRSLERVRERLAELERHIRQARRDARAVRRVRELEGRAAELELAHRLGRRSVWLEQLAESAAPLARGEAEAGRRARSLETTERFLGALRLAQGARETRFGELTRRAFEHRSRRDRAAAALEEGEAASGRRAADRERLDREEAELTASVRRRQTGLEESARRAAALPGRVEELTLQLRERSEAQGAAREAERRCHLALEAARRERDRLGAAIRTARLTHRQHLDAGERLQRERFGLDGSRRALEARAAHLAGAEEEARRALESAGAALVERRAERDAAEKRSRDAAAAVRAARSDHQVSDRALAEVEARLEAQRALVLSREQLGAAAARRLGATGRDARLLGAVGEAIEVEPGFEAAAETLVGVHRLRVARVRDLLELFGEPGAPDGGPLEVLVSELAAASRAESPGTADSGADRLRARVTASDPAVRAAVPDAEIVPDLGAAVARFTERPGVYVTRGGESVSPPGVVRFGRGGPGAGFLDARRELRDLERGASSARGRLEAARRTLAAREAELAAAEEIGETRKREFAAARAEVERLRRAAEGAAAAGVEAGRQRLELLARIERNREDDQRNAAALHRAATSLEADEEQLERTSEEVAAGRIELAAARERLAAAEDAFRAADRSRTREEAVAAEIRRAEAAREAELEADRARLARIGGARSRIAEEAEAWNIRRESAARQQAQAEAEALAAEAEAERVGDELARLRERVRIGEACLPRRRAELAAVRAEVAQIGARASEASTLLGHLEREFEKDHGQPLELAAARVPERLWRRPVEATAEDLAAVRDELVRRGPVNQVAETRLAELEAERDGPAGRLRDVEAGIADGLRALARQDREARRAFEEGFGEVRRHFDEAFRRLFGGGRAELRLVGKAEPGTPGDASNRAFRNGAASNGAVAGNGVHSPEDDARPPAGVEIFAEPPGKKFQSARLLSGGEKAMTAIAFLIALFRYRPAPFCLLDEVDAPLDDPNAQRFAALLDELREETQLVVITHNRLTMEACEHLYGVTMEEPGVSRVVSLELGGEGFGRWVAGDGAVGPAMPAQ